MPREVTDDLSMLERLVAPAGKDVLDIGCGGGALVRELASRGARVVGLEISAEQLAPALARAEATSAEAAARTTARTTASTTARTTASTTASTTARTTASTTAATTVTTTAAEAATAPRYVIGRAEALPVADGSVDVAVFMRTLHHVPPPDLLEALREARRVLRPDGVVYVAEPLAEGDYFELTSLIEDELEVRAAAQSALTAASRAGLERVTTVDYDVRLCIAGLAGLRARSVSVDPQRASAFDAREAEIGEAFERLGEPGERPGERCFRQPMRADVLRAPAVESRQPDPG